MATDDKPAKVICLTEARRRFDAKKCQHLDVIVDERLAEVKCAKCGIGLNPINVLVRFAREESQWMNNYKAMQEQKRLLDEKQRTKCRHCGKITPIRVR